MSTFDGHVAEFPDIRVDFFRRSPGRRAPLACFVSHIHSDHLAGLESLRSPFVYCSAATRELLLRLERFPCRINYAKGVLEARVQTYKHLKNLLKPIPMETPTVLELEPGNHIQVTLFNANHCPGAVMFLFEGNGKAALYTGDIRSEPWFVNTLVRSPCLIEYAHGLKTLDTLYLDTSFVDDIPFQAKAEGIRELLQKVAKYPPDTIFHLQAWTYGYEDVWLALSKSLGSKIHVDEYKMRIYQSLVAKDTTNRYGAEVHMSPEAPGLVGFVCGNARHEGCLTMDESVRIHSCEKGNYCSTIQNSPVVWIQPIVAHLPNGQDVAELGVGGGGDDLVREAELGSMSPEEVQHLLQVICDTDSIPDELKESTRALLLDAIADDRNVSLDVDLALFGDQNEAMIGTAVQAIAKKLQLRRDERVLRAQDTAAPEPLPNVITFPYSRHSSYEELCHLVEAFNPKDVWPCTVSPGEWVQNDISIRKLFGAYSTGSIFRHDVFMESLNGTHRIVPNDPDSQITTSSAEIPLEPLIPLRQIETSSTTRPPQLPEQARWASLEQRGKTDMLQSTIDSSCSKVLSFQGVHHEDLDEPMSDTVVEEEEYLQDSQASAISESARELRAEAFRTMLQNVRGQEWRPIGLISTTDNHTLPEVDLGER